MKIDLSIYPTLKEKRQAFLDDMVQYYSADPERRRNIDCLGNCKYYPLNPNSEGCAIGRHLDPDLAMKLDCMEGLAVSNYEIFSLLPEPMKELGQDFLKKVQEFHDKTWNWNSSGLREDGLNELDSIKMTLC